MKRRLTIVEDIDAFGGRKLEVVIWQFGIDLNFFNQVKGEWGFVVEVDCLDCEVFAQVDAHELAWAFGRLQCQYQATTDSGVVFVCERERFVISQ